MRGGPGRRSSGFGWNRQIHGYPWPGHQHVVHTSIHVAKAIETEFKDARKQCRVDAIAVLTELENEPNCLDSGFPVRRRHLVYSLVNRHLRGMLRIGLTLA